MSIKNIALLIIGIILIGGGVLFIAKQNAKAPGVNPSKPATQDGVGVTIENYKFGPDILTVKRGAIVNWTNKDAVSHIVAGDDASWTAGPIIKQGDVYERAFDAVGTFTYHCTIHPSMHGTIVVTQ